jgi:hypothetical protein
VQQHLWLSPIIGLLLVVGIVQPMAMVVIWFSQRNKQSDWAAIKYLTLSTMALLSLSFIFSVKAPASHTFYLTLPVAMVYSFYCWSSLLMKRGWQIFAAIFLGCGIVFHIALGVHHFERVSLYVDRAIPVSAIEQRDYRILGERRSGSRY